MLSEVWESRNVLDDQNVTQTIPNTCSICQKINYIEIRKQKKTLYFILEMSTAFSDAYINTEGRPERFLSCTYPVSRKRFTRRCTVDLFGTGESENVSLNSFYQDGCLLGCSAV
jgi:hypothetical protein